MEKWFIISIRRKTDIVRMTQKKGGQKVEIYEKEFL